MYLDVKNTSKHLSGPFPPAVSKILHYLDRMEQVKVSEIYGKISNTYPREMSCWMPSWLLCCSISSRHSPEFVELIIGMTGMIKSKNFVRSESLNISSRIAYTKMTGSLIVSQLFSSVFSSLSMPGSPATVKLNSQLKASCECAMNMQKPTIIQ